MAAIAWLVTTVTYGYDDVGNLTSVTDPAGTTTLAYNGLNQLIGEDPPGIPAYTYGWDWKKDCGGHVGSRPKGGLATGIGSALTSRSITGLGGSAMTLSASP